MCDIVESICDSATNLFSCFVTFFSRFFFPSVVLKEPLDRLALGAANFWCQNASRNKCVPKIAPLRLGGIYLFFLACLAASRHPCLYCPPWSSIHGSATKTPAYPGLSLSETFLYLHILRELSSALPDHG